MFRVDSGSNSKLPLPEQVPRILGPGGLYYAKAPNPTSTDCPKFSKQVLNADDALLYMPPHDQESIIQQSKITN